jgi:hypothetical protein
MNVKHSNVFTNPEVLERLNTKQITKNKITQNKQYNNL